MSSFTSNKKTRGAKNKNKIKIKQTNQKKKKPDIYKQVNNLQTCKKEETQEPKSQRCRTPLRYECSSSGAKKHRDEKKATVSRGFQKSAAIKEERKRRK
jgi:hypothetical protein